ncbi:alpha-D-glucose phosphate-specific phosphoglucomutase [Caminibacter sp.]
MKPGMLPDKNSLVNIADLITKYFYYKKDLKPVKFGTSGHRGSAFKKSFNEKHIFAISEAIAKYKNLTNQNGPLYIGIDTHALSTPALASALRVFASKGITVKTTDKYTPTPLVSFAVLEHNRKNEELADGAVITPSHNPPEDGGYKYNTPNGGAADTDVTKMIEKFANEKLNSQEKYKDYEEAINSEFIQKHDFITPYIESLDEIVDMNAIKNSKIKFAVAPLGGSSVDVYKELRKKINFEIIDGYVDFTFSFITLDHDGKIRMDCSSPYAMAGVVKHKDKFDLIVANDTDADRHGIVTKEGLMNPNHFLSVAIWYLFRTRDWKNVKIGKTVVTTSMIDRIAEYLGVEVYETPVGFKYFGEGLFEGWLGVGCEESAGASFLRYDATPWVTDKDGIVMGLLAAEIFTKEKSPSEIYQDLEEKFGKCYYERIDIPASEEEKNKIKNIKIDIDTFGGEKVEKILTRAPGNNEPIGGVKIVTKNGWAVIRPSGTEDIIKVYAESFISENHLKMLQKEALNLIKGG